MENTCEAPAEAPAATAASEAETLQQIRLLLDEIAVLVARVRDARTSERRLTERRKEEGIPAAFAELSDWWEWRARRAELDREICEARQAIEQGEERLWSIVGRLELAGMPRGVWFRSGEFGIRLDAHDHRLTVRPWSEATAGLCVYPDEVPF